jgi:hypothetical protein
MFYGQWIGLTTQVLVEVIDGHSVLLGPVTHETKPLDVTIGSHINKVIFWRTPNSLKDSNVSPSERQRKREESGRAP